MGALEVVGDKIQLCPALVLSRAGDEAIGE